MAVAGRSETDVCIIGSGPAGSMAAFELTRRGRDVTVLERGPYLAASALALGEAPPQWGLAEIAPAAQARGEVRPMMPAQVGGGGEIFGAAAHRFLPEDFRMASARGAVDAAQVADWPFSYDDLEPFYARAEAIIGVSGADGVGRHPPPRSTPYPLPPLACDEEAVRRLDGACARLGLHSIPTPLAILSSEYRGRAPCARCGFCVGFPCLYSSKGSPTATTLRAAVDTGRCRIVAGVTAHRLLVDGTAAGAVEYSDERGRKAELGARLFVLACGAIFTPRLLLLSRSPRFPDGLGNHAGLLGRFFASHITPAVTGTFAERVHRPNTHFVARSIDDFYFGEPPAWKGGVVQLHLSGGVPLMLAGGAATARERLGKQVNLYYCGDVLPQAHNRVVLARTLDRFGYPLPRVEFEYHPLDLASGRMGARHAARLLEEMGASVAADPARVASWGSGFHFSGTCRAGRDEATSVVDADGRVHGADNVYVCDASVFPTSGGFNPALTVSAVALRTASRIP
jgi:choline dehydrogenase-like flavoprotein